MLTRAKTAIESTEQTLKDAQARAHNPAVVDPSAGDVPLFVEH